jgi:hypothetical protein
MTPLSLYIVKCERISDVSRNLSMALGVCARVCLCRKFIEKMCLRKTRVQWADVQNISRISLFGKSEC